jgi:ABC-type nitrate/sulfonate/bicarbonate transport system substrate-binding protein
MGLRRTKAAALALALLVASPASAETVRTIVPTPDNLQLAVFWTAYEAGYFKDEGLDVTLSIPSAPQLTKAMVLEGSYEAAALPPPTYLDLIAETAPILLIANLLANDPINLIVSKNVKAKTDGPVGERLQSLKGLKIGVAPHPPRRLRELFAAHGMDADKDIEMVILGGKQQNEAFRSGKVDGLYAHTPYLERAMLDDGAVMVVNQSAGEVPALAGRQIHALAVKRGTPRALIDKLVRAVARAEETLRKDRPAAVRALSKRFPETRHLEKILEIYLPAIPASTHVSVEGTRDALKHYPAGQTPPDLSKVNLAEYVDSPPAAPQPAAPKRSWRTIPIYISLGILAVCLVAAALRWKRK